MMRSDMTQQIARPGMNKPVPVGGKRPMKPMLPRQAFKKGGMVSPKGNGCCAKTKSCKMS